MFEPSYFRMPFINILQLIKIYYLEFMSILHIGVLGLSFINIEFPQSKAGIMWFIADKIGKSNEERISTVPS